jgi:hypothetical protein
MNTKIPKNAKRIPLRPLALGEATGHHHSLCTIDETPVEDVCEMYEFETENGVKTYLRVTAEGVALTHQEHKTQPIAPGEYEITIQQENSDWGVRPVQD